MIRWTKIRKKCRLWDGRCRWADGVLQVGSRTVAGGHFCQPPATGIRLPEHITLQVERDFAHLQRSAVPPATFPFAPAAGNHPLLSPSGRGPTKLIYILNDDYELLLISSNSSAIAGLTSRIRLSSSFSLDRRFMLPYQTKELSITAYRSQQ